MGLAATALLLVALTGHGAWPQQPRAIRIIVPFPAGGSADIVTRLLADEIGRSQTVNMVVENRPGASAVLGTEAAARAAPDGNTLLITAPSFVINAHLRKVGYDPRASFEPICVLVNSPQIIVVNAGSPYRSLADLLSAARTSPGALSLASVGPGSNSHLAFELMKRRAGVDITYVPYPGNGPAVNALLGEHVTSAFVDYLAAAGEIKSGQLRAIATGSPGRIEPMPELPTLVELGLVDETADVWFAVVAPAHTPPDVMSRLAGWFRAALQAPALAPKLVAQGLYPAGTCGADFAAFIQRQYDEAGRIVRAAKIEAQ